jgi:hypothetical protein
MVLADGDLPLVDVFWTAVTLLLRVLRVSVLSIPCNDVFSRPDLGTGPASPGPG